MTKLPDFIGLDLSLSATGFVRVSPNGSFMSYETIRSKPEGESPKDEMRRLLKLTSEVENFIPPKNVKEVFVAMEGLAFRSNRHGHSGVVGFAYLVRKMLMDKGVNFALVAPLSLKKFVCDDGKAEKNMMLMKVLQNWGFAAPNDNIADAAGLAKLAYYAYNGDKDEELTKRQLEVVELVRKQIYD